MKLSIVRYSSDNRTEKQGYWERPLAFLADLFTGVEQRREVDYFSQHFVEEMVGLKELPMDVIYPYVALNQNTNSPMTLKTRIQISDDGVKKFGVDSVGNFFRDKTRVDIYGAPAFDITFLSYRSVKNRRARKSKMTITRKVGAYPVQ